MSSIFGETVRGATSAGGMVRAMRADHESERQMDSDHETDESKEQKIENKKKRKKNYSSSSD